MAEGSHAATGGRSLIERLFWLWVGLALVVGLAIGGGLFLYQRASSIARYNNLAKTAAELRVQRDAARATSAKLQSELASAQMVASTGTTEPVDAVPVPGALPKPKAGEIGFVSRVVDPSPATAAKPLKLAVVLVGKATDVYMQIKNDTYSKVWQLHKAPGSSASGPVTWMRSDGVAPKTAGDYLLFAWGFVGKKKFVMSGAGNLTVK
jgi:hypothetical protein